MKILIFLVFAGTAFSQNLLHQPENRKLFADHLFCTEDYLRAAEEYELYLESVQDDSAEFKIALSLAALEKYDESIKRFDSLTDSKSFGKYIASEKVKIFIRSGEYSRINEVFPVYDDVSETNSDSKLRNATYLFRDRSPLPSPPYLNIPFNDTERQEITGFYEMKMGLPSKNPQLAGFLSAMVPGLGKIYTEDYSDAFFAMLTTGVFGYLAYANFKADHQFRGYLFSGVAAWFYGGNIYGSVASAQLFNAKVSFSFTSLLSRYLENKNYFLPDYGFCK